LKQLTQNLQTGKMELLEVPFPALNKGQILVRNHYSLISAGAEDMKVVTARKGYIGKAKEKPDQVKQVLDSIKMEGLIPTYKKVMNKLDSFSPLGYSTSGEVVEVGEKVPDFKIGDLVACAGGGYANHAEVNYIPKNLCAKIPIGFNGERITLTALIFGRHADYFNHIIKMQVINYAPGKLIVRIVPKGSFSDSHANEVVNNLSIKEGMPFETKVEIVDEIDKTTRGKHRFLIRTFD